MRLLKKSNIFKKSTRASLLSGELVNQDQNSGGVNRFGGDEEVVVISNQKFQRHQRAEHGRDGQERLDLHRLAPDPREQLVHRRTPPPPHPCFSAFK